MHWLSRRFELLPLHIRFLIAPSLGLACAVLMVLALVLESERQNVLLQHLAHEELPALEMLTSVSNTLARNHTDLFSLLHDAREQLDEAQLYERAKAHIEVMRHLSEQFDQALGQPFLRDNEQLQIAELHQSLLESTRAYVTRAISAIELSTVNLNLASRELVAINGSFIRISEQFLQLQEQARDELGVSIRQSAEQTRKRVLWLSFAALLLGIAVLLLTLRLTRQLTHTLEGHILVLAQLEREAGGSVARLGSKGVLEAMANAIAAFRETLDKLKHSKASLRQANSSLQQAHDELEQRVQQRTRELRETQSELIATARQAGMSEIATNVLHNVGNVLNSVNISAELVSRRVSASKDQGLAKAVQLINEHAADLGNFITHDEKGKLLPGYLNQLVEVLAAEKQSIVEELGQLTNRVNHIKNIVATQQSYAGASSIVEPLQITDLLEEALHIHIGTLTRHQITVVKEYGEVPVLLLDKHKVLLILINLISNAKHAMAYLVDRSREMTLSVDINESNLRIRVKDEGEGITPENLTRLFVHGFTTRKDGHGFGLHSCALAATEMEGSLVAHSEGPGKGAIFTLELPLKTAV
jgi:signal transduction histidine kinase